MAKTITKAELGPDGRTLAITYSEAFPVMVKTLTWTYAGALRQKNAILAQRNQQIADRDREIAEMDDIIAEMKKANVPEPTPEEMESTLL